MTLDLRDLKPTSDEYEAILKLLGDIQTRQLSEMTEDELNSYLSSRQQPQSQ
jgi:hypothetical protein